MQKICITKTMEKNELVIYEIKPSKKGLRKIKKRILNKSKDLEMYSEVKIIRKYPDCFKLDFGQVPVKEVTKIINVGTLLIYTAIYYPELVKLIEELRRGDFSHFSDLMRFSESEPEIISEIISNLKVREIYRSTYDNYCDLFEKIQTYGDDNICNSLSDTDKIFKITDCDLFLETREKILKL